MGCSKLRAQRPGNESCLVRVRYCCCFTRRPILPRRSLRRKAKRPSASSSRTRAVFAFTFSIRSTRETSSDACSNNSERRRYYGTRRFFRFRNFRSNEIAKIDKRKTRFATPFIRSDVTRFVYDRR